MILHITTRVEWEAAQNARFYEPPSLATEGFIHCSTAEQVLATANRFFHGRSGLVLLLIDPAKTGVGLEWESAVDAPGSFPHLYGSLPVNAVIAVIDFPCQLDGAFRMPPELRIK